MAIPSQSSQNPRRSAVATLGWPLLALAAIVAVPVLSAPAGQRASARAADPRALEPTVAALRARPGQELTAKSHQCVIQSIQCGQTIASQITQHDCLTDPPDPFYFDFFEFQGTNGQTVTVTMSSNDFDPFLFLIDPDDGEPVAQDDNDGPGNAARIVHVLDRTSPSWGIGATPLETVTGSYTLSLQCSSSTPPPPGFFADPAYPDFWFKVEITAGGSVIPGVREPDCIDETVCVSGALPGRSELFLRIIGPRPNGFLWPTLVRFTPSRVDVTIRQISSGDEQKYTLDAVPPGTDELPGLQDRMGFLP